MESLRIIPNIDHGVDPELRDKAARASRLTDAAFMGVPRGTLAGRASVMVLLHDESGNPHVFETTLALLESAVRGIQAGTEGH